MRPTVLLDCDEVLADFTAVTLDIVHEITNHRYYRKDIHTWEIFDSLPLEPLWVKQAAYRRLKSPGGCVGMPLCKGAGDAVEMLSKIANLVVVTHPFEGSETWAHERELWLDKHFGRAIDGVIHTKDKARVHGDLFVDDKPRNVTSWLDYWVRSNRDRGCTGIHWENGRTISEARDPLCISTSNWRDVEDLVKLRAAAMS
jgi:5'(3')-deoxyribonucleotidase